MDMISTFCRYLDAVNKRLNSIVNPERGFGVDQEE